MNIYHIIIFVLCLVIAGGSYVVYHTLHNPVTVFVDRVSEEVLGVDLDPLYDSLDPQNKNPTL